MPLFLNISDDFQIQNYYTSPDARDVNDVKLPDTFDIRTIDINRDTDTGEFVFSSNVIKENMLKKYMLDGLRENRNQLLDKTDRYTTIDYPHPTEEAKQMWLDYRQALRDLPSNTTDPENPVWPQAPTP
jgi:hypothetical protein